MFWIAILCSAVTVGANFLVGHFSVVLLLILWSVIWSVSYLTNPLLTLPHHHLIFDSTFCKLKHALPFRISRKTNRWISKPYHFTTTCLYYYYTLPKFPTQSPKNYSHHLSYTFIADLPLSPVSIYQHSTLWTILNLKGVKMLVISSGFLNTEMCKYSFDHIWWIFSRRIVFVYCIRADFELADRDRFCMSYQTIFPFPCSIN